MITFRRATYEDAKLLWEWANEESVRENAFDQKPIPWDSHLEWLNEKLSSDDSYIFIAEIKDDQAIGQIRFDLQNKKKAFVDVSITKAQRGKGYGSKVIKLGTRHFINLEPGVTVHAFIKKTNVGSKKAFEYAGYKLRQIKNVNGYESFHMIFSPKNKN